MFLGVEHALSAVGWDDPSLDKLWRYNLHYFEDLNAEGAPERSEAHQALLSRWIADNAPGQGTGWEPYPTSLRIVNWIKAFLNGQAPQDEWLVSLAVQARWLCKRLEWHLLGNHLFANAKALVFAGLYFDGPEAESWLARGAEILEEQLAEQVLADGGHFEGSPMYHALLLEDVLDLIAIVEARAPKEAAIRRLEGPLRSAAPKMLFWLHAMSHPDGFLALFNDTAQGIAPPTTELERLAAQLDISAVTPMFSGVTSLPASGYARCDWDEAVALLDVAPVGPDYLPGHAHADTLSFELSIHGTRIVVNGGTSCYGLGARRALERGTAAHSTVEIAGENSSEVWSSFRVGRRARPVQLAIAEHDVSCAHHGYRHLPGHPLHYRHWHFGDNSLKVHDTVSGSLPAIARYHLSPGLQLREETAGSWTVVQGGKLLATVQVPVGAARAAKVLHAVAFGVLEASQTLEVVLERGEATTLWSW